MSSSWSGRVLSLFLMIFSMVACSGKAPKSSSETPIEHSKESTAGFSSAYRSIASEENIESFEQRFKEILNSGNAEKGMIYHLNLLYTLALETNVQIGIFEKQLDEQLKQHRAHPEQEVQGPLESEVYKKLMKYWALSEMYQSEIKYFFMRSLQIRTDSNLSREERVRAGEIKKHVVDYLKKANLLQRVELQDLTGDLKLIFDDFIQDYRNSKKQVHNGTQETTVDEGIQQDLESENPFQKLLTVSNKDWAKAQSQINKMITKLKFQGSGEVKYQAYKSRIEEDLKSILEPIQSREPDAVQNLKCGDGKKVCVSAGESGNMIGTIFPKGVWALTYDDGPAAKSTGDIMELLHNYRDKVNTEGRATFFWLAKNIVQYPKWAKMGLDYGFKLENHSFTHANLAKLGPNGLNHEIVESNQVLSKEIHKFNPEYVIQYFRCPYGACYAPKVTAVRNLLVAQNQVHVYWRIDSLDWKLRDGPKVANLIIKQMQLMDHGIVLMHDIHPTTVEATRQVLAWIKEQNDSKGKNYRLVTIPQAVDMVNGG